MYPKNGKMDSVSKTSGGRINKIFAYGKASLCASQQRRKYVLNEKPNNVSVERRQDVSAVCVHDTLLERHDVLRGRNNYVPLVRLHDISKKSQMKHSMMSQW